jgi:predicted flavoprotein YhiN
MSAPVEPLAPAQTLTASTQRADIVVIGAGAAGLFAALWAGRTHRPLRILALDGARILGAKILVAGGGRCNVTHDVVDEHQYAGSSPHAIKKLLRRFDVPETVAFFKELGVELKREETGKLFPVTDDARTVLDALLRAAKAAGVEIVHPWRVADIAQSAPDNTFLLTRAPTAPTAQTEPSDPRTDTRTNPWHACTHIRASRIILATGGQSLPKTGSDGAGFAFATALGHSLTPHIFPSLVPLTLPKDHWLCALSGITLPAALELRSATGKRLKRFVGSTLLAHFGLSGPAVLDISRYWTAARATDPDASLFLSFVPGLSALEADAALARRDPTTNITLLRWISESTPDRLPERLARALCAAAHIDPTMLVRDLTKDARRALAHTLCDLRLPITGDRGWLFAEVTAGGVPLSELRLETMESRVCPGLHLCGEICDVDGRIGGYNFQWAWATGYTAGISAAQHLSAVQP